MPDSCSSSMRSATWKRSSRSRSRSMRAGRTTLRRRPSHLRIAHDLPDARGETLPAFLLVGELFAAEPRERIEARFAILLGDAPFRADPSGLFHTMQRRVERALLNTQELIGNRVDVGR